jgi:hypothetical protein
MAFMLIQGFYPEPNPDNSLQYEADVSAYLETSGLAVMGWSSQTDVPPGDHDLTTAQASEILSIPGEPFRPDLIYGIGLCRS